MKPSGISVPDWKIMQVQTKDTGNVGGCKHVKIRAYSGSLQTYEKISTGYY